VLDSRSASLSMPHLLAALNEEGRGRWPRVRPRLLKTTEISRNTSCCSRWSWAQ